MGSHWIVDVLVAITYVIGVVWDLLSRVGSSLTGVINVGVIVAVASLAWNIWKDRKQRQREIEMERKELEKAEQLRQTELKGLLILLFREIKMYETVWATLERDPLWLVRAPAYLLSTKVWEDIRPRLGPLLPIEEYADMMHLFQNINIIDEVRRRPDLYSEFMSNVQPGNLKGFCQAMVKSPNGVPQLKERTTKVKEHMYKYVSDDDFQGSFGVLFRSPK